jgi:hypothetical protein
MTGSPTGWGFEMASPDTTVRADLWTKRARPTFLYVMYGMILFALPLGLVAALSPVIATRISLGITSYLAAIPEALWTLFGASYLGYTAARQWGKVKGVDG